MLKSKTIKVQVPDGETRLRMVVTLAKTFHGIDADENDGIIENISNKLCGRDAKFIIGAMKKASQIKIKRSFWERVCRKPRECVPSKILKKKVDKVLKLRQ